MLPFRYPYDAYDRYWRSDSIGEEDGWTKIATSSTIYAASSTDEAFGLPAKVMKTAAITKNASIPLKVNFTDLDPGSKYYYYFHFAEVEKLEPGQQRELTISLDGQRYLTESLKLDYLNPHTIIQDNPPITGVSQFYFSINAAKGTQLPPILNAYEIFLLIDLSIEPTATDDDMVTKSDIKSKNRKYSYSEVVKITKNFKTIIGKGGFGNVYLGKLKDKTQVAIKLLSALSNQGFKEFRAEEQLLMVVHHRNLVNLVGYCDDEEKKALIYEYMANGNLQQHLSVTNPNVLAWDERLCIAVDAAHGLEYLHNGCKPPIIHRDLKPPNILLNEYMQAKIVDFGLSRAFAAESDSHVSTCPAGTLGYVDPEIPTSGNFNKKSDIYSFGIILLELITGRPAITRGPMQNNHIIDWVYPLIESADIQSVVDPRLEGEFNTTSAWKVVEIAMLCVLPDAIQRPDMSQVLVELKECLALVMNHGRNQSLASMPHNTFHLEVESEITPIAR